ncbi:hypothetical protein Tco_0920538 [Tanacetum coccineum]
MIAGVPRVHEDDVAKTVFRMRNRHVEIYGYAFSVNQCTSGFHEVNEPGGVRVAREDDHGVSEGREDVREVLQQRGRGAKRKLSRCGRNQMGNEPILALPEGADDFVVYYDARSKDLEACLEKGEGDCLYVATTEGNVISSWIRMLEVSGGLRLTRELFVFSRHRCCVERRAVSSISGIVDMYLASKMKEAVDVAIQLQKNKLREEAQAENQEFLNQVDSNMKTIIKDQVKAQVSKIMPKIEKYVTESLGPELLVRSTSQPRMAYAVAASLLKFELTKILIDKIEANKSINISDNQKNLYNALVKSYNSDKDIITSYGDVVLLKSGRDDQDKDEDPSAGSDRRTKRRKSGKDTKSSKDSRSKEKKSSSTSKDAS